MAQRAVVIGAGAIGVAVAYYLHDTGWQVTLVDRGDIGHGCSYANACLIVPSHSRPLPGPGVLAQALRWALRPDSPFCVRPRLDPGLLRWLWQFRRFCSAEAAERGFQALLALSRLSLDLFDDMARRGRPSFYYERKGLLNVYLTEAGGALARRERHALEAAGLRVRLLSGPEARALEPALHDRIHTVLFVEGDAHADCLEYVRALAADLSTRGVTLLPHRSVRRILLAAGRVRGILLESPDDELAGDLVVLAAGAWTPALTAPLGIALPLEPAKGYSCTVDAYPKAPRLPILVHETRVAIAPLGPRLRLGGTLELAGLDLSLNPARYQAVIRGAQAALREPVPLTREEAWCGLRPLTPDGLPIIDRAAGIDGLILATGHGTLGFTQSLATGKLVADLANGEPPCLPAAPFRLARFSRG